MYLYLKYISKVSAHYIHQNFDTYLPAYSDTLGTWEKCHCNQIVTATQAFVHLICGSNLLHCIVTW